MECKKRNPVRVEIPVDESRVFSDGRRYRFVAGGGCQECALWLKNRGESAGPLLTTCAATAWTIEKGAPVYPCSSESRRDMLYGHFERVSAFETLQKLLRRIVWALVIGAVALTVAFAAAVANGAEYQPKEIQTFEDVHRATCRVVCVDSTGRGAMGTGTVVGYDEKADAFEVLTNYHVVQGHSSASLHFFGDGRRVDCDNVPVVATYYDEKLPIDAAILKVKRTPELSRYDPPVAPLAPAGYKPKEGAYIWSAGCSEGRWAAAWKGGVESYYGETAQFYPAPKGGQSGSAIIERTKWGLRVVGILTWRVGDDKTTGEENMRGGAITISKLYEAASGRRATGEIDSIPPNAKFCASPVRYRLIYFYSANCDGCATATPVLRGLYAAGYDICSVALDAEPGASVAKRFGVRLTPSFLLVREMTAEERNDPKLATALELWYGPDDLERRVQLAFARAARLRVPTTPTVRVPPTVPAPELNLPPVAPTFPPAPPQTPTPDAETSYPVTAATSPAYFQNVAFSTDTDEKDDDAANCVGDVCEIAVSAVPVVPADDAAETASPVVPTPELGEIAPVSRGSDDAERLLDRYRDGFNGFGRRDDRTDDAPERADDESATGPLRGALDRAAQNAIDKIAKSATETITEKVEAFEADARARVAEAAGRVAFWGAAFAAVWYWIVRAVGAIFGAALRILPRIEIRDEPTKEKNGNDE